LFILNQKTLLFQEVLWLIMNGLGRLLGSHSADPNQVVTFSLNKLLEQLSAMSRALSFPSEMNFG
jgi:hypothetical protein